MSIKSKLKTVASYVTPWRSVSRAGKQVADSGRSIGRSVIDIRDAMRARRQRDIDNALVEAEALRARAGASPAELYQTAADLRGWTPDEERRQQAARRRAKWSWWFGFIIFAGALVASVITSHGGLSLWSVSMIICAPLVILVLPALAAREAHIEWQIQRRELLPFSVFFGQSDFFRRVIL